MYFSKREEKIIKSLCKAVSISNEIDDFFIFKWKYGTEIYAIYITTDEDDNGLDMYDPDYEEFISFIIRIKKLKSFNSLDGFKKEWLKEGVLFEFSYHDFPDEIYNSKGELISKKPK